ncbi:MAG TPA: hypothetical protein VG410_12550 [Solirubrobacteraceae bacterium]|jgi:hypothetical protein|nr:hypothetical protein [Solirubrobacteraceae bacterium]
MHPTARRLRERLHELGLEVDVMMVDDSARTAKDSIGVIPSLRWRSFRAVVFTKRSQGT